MPKIYRVIEATPSTCACKGYFSTREKADEYIAGMVAQTDLPEYIVEEGELDPPVPVVHQRWTCNIDIGSGKISNEFTRLDREPIERCVASIISSHLIFAVSYVSAEHCGEIANDFLREFLAGNIPTSNPCKYYD